MATFSYEAIDLSGKRVKGSIEAEDVEGVKQELRKLNVTPSVIKKQGLLSKDLNIEIGGYPKARDLSVFCRQFVSMFRAGVPMIDALRMLGESTENKKLQKAIESVRINVEKGETLSSALSEHPRIFPELMVSLTAAGEASGSLDISMERMATQLEQSTKTRAAVKKAMTYPVVVLSVAVIVMIVLLVKVIPSYTSMFEELDAKLPKITVMVKGASDFIQAKWYVVLVAVIALVVGIKTFVQTNMGKHVVGKIILSIGPVRNLSQKSNSAMMARTLSTLISSGIPLTEAVDIVSGIMKNVYYKEALEEAKNQIAIGQPLSVPLEDSGLFPPMVYYMTRIGEETGNSEEMLDKLAEYYEEEVNGAVAGLMSFMEPLIIILLAGVVGIIIAACLLPMMSMYEAVG